MPTDPITVSRHGGRRFDSAARQEVLTHYPSRGKDINSGINAAF